MKVPSNLRSLLYRMLDYSNWHTDLRKIESKLDQLNLIWEEMILRNSTDIMISAGTYFIIAWNTIGLLALQSEPDNKIVDAQIMPTRIHRGIFIQLGLG